ncbi:leucyl/phenylalanyl-tRNA--protein transferase [Rheinheimera aquimaris]|uniref:leucyl/phenylalanyl-tRNA--protein transferase n=1 Tax=Rheinheimera aquimaris TaxID=412437 RepID=UPI001E3FF0BD|nr:leucyl/phenylalanyl-tRNA--protein transferase [Rheinheimera aquimaris]MCD1599215.1 leucyl/phenylalanyl-tRNA--protein transferase [Rheinheimera aquimaris]
MTIYLPELDAHDVSFPELHHALTEPDGLLAMGGDLSTARLINAYSSGIFPWFSEGDPMLWWSPSVRAVFPPDTLTLNRTLRKQIRRYNLHFSVNTAFAEVTRHCAAPRVRQPGTWILPQMQQAYLQLHHLGFAHSIEVWQHNKLVGGLYGVMIGQLFCGESMFNFLPDAAKIALVVLQQHLKAVAEGWIDCQLPNPFLQQMGVQSIPREEYISLLKQLKDKTVVKSHWQAGTIAQDIADA